MKTPNLYTKQLERSGFALIASLSIMVLLVMLVVGMLTLANTETRSANQDKFRMEARANARMALMIALGELQEAAGPDQRVTAWSNILDEDPKTDAADGINNPNLLGVWDSWNTYITDKMKHPTNGSLDIQDTYIKGRPQLFRKWLVSHSDDQKKETWNAVLANGGSSLGFNATNSVELVAKGSLGSTVDRSEYVRAGKMDVTDKSGVISGSYAWWVGGDNLKSQLDVVKSEYVSASAPEVVGEQLDFANSHMSDPINAAGYDAFPEDPVIREKLVSNATSVASTVVGSSKVDQSRSGFFDFGVEAKSLLVDVRRGGVKQDLNTLFEDENVTDARFTRYTAGDTVIDAPIRRIDGAIAGAATGLNNPNTYLPSWRQMREYYGLYRSASNFGLDWSGSTPYSDRHVRKEGNYVETSDYTRTPILYRHSYVVGLKREASSTAGKDSLRVMLIPLLVFWNPYNTEMRFSADEICTNIEFEWNIRLGLKIFQGSTEVKPASYAKTDPFGWYGFGDLVGKSGLSNTFRNAMKRATIRGGSNDATSGNNVVMKPGELVMFSLDGKNQVSVANGGTRAVLEKGFLRSTAGGITLPNLSNQKILVDQGSTCHLALKFGGRHKAQRAYNLGCHKNGLMTLVSQGTLAKGVYDDRDSPRTGGTYGFPVGGLNVNWLAEKGMDESDYQVEILPQSDMAKWPSSVSNTVFPAAVINFTAKTGLQIVHSDGSVPEDYRGRSWLQSPVAESVNILGAPNQLSRVDFPFTMDYEVLSGSNVGMADAVSVNTQKGDKFGQAFGGPESTFNGVSQIVTQEIPTAPPTSLSHFATMRLKPAAVHTAAGEGSGGGNESERIAWRNAGVRGAAYGVGIGNGYGHPMVPAGEILESFTSSDWLHVGHLKSGNESSFTDSTWGDYWDQQLITNDALWDEWFCSSFVPTTGPSEGQRIVRPLQDVAESFLNGKESLSNSRLTLSLPEGQTSDDAIAVVGSAEAYKKVAAFLALNGGFNVNSTSVEAWRALLEGLKEREVPFYDAQTGSTGVISSKSTVTLSRFRLAASAGEGRDASDPHAWTGVRQISDSQLDKLADEIVKQVKLRGPFLNMSEFINRRIDKPGKGGKSLSVASTLQAAIDWDEFDSSSGSGLSSQSSEETSINHRFKGVDDMLTSPNADFPNGKAAVGSVYAGIPGYVMASDVLQATGDMLTPRCDSFTIRSYGESIDEKGKVQARAWCEVRVQRSIDYVDSTDEAWEVQADALGHNLQNSKSEGLSATNIQYGRKFKVLSFRWLSKEEI